MKMDSKDYFYQLFMNNYEIFKTQDPQDNHFDVVFDFGGKKLHANKFMLCSASTIFKSMITDQKSDEPIIVADYTYEDFKELLTFIYSGECLLTEDNIFGLVRMAQFYGIQLFKDFCEEFLTKMDDFELDDICEILEFSTKYSLARFKKHFHEYVSEHLFGDWGLLRSCRFIYYNKFIVKEIVEFNQETERQEELFEAVFNWAKNQANEKQTLDETLDLNTAIKNELSDVLPLLKFEKMDDLFILDLVVKKSFLFSGDELSNMLSARIKIYVKITDANGKEMKGQLKCDDAERVVEIIRSFKDDTCMDCAPDRGHCFYWWAKEPKPPAPSKLIKNNGVEWYLAYDKEGDIVCRHQDGVQDADYLLAEMFPENGFELSEECKIVVFCFA